MNVRRYNLDFSNVKYYLEIHKIIQESFGFPDYYGCNWSAFWDCLTDLYGEPIHIRIVGLEVIERKFDDAADKIISVLKRFKYFEEAFADDIRIELLSEDNGIIIL